MHVRSARAIMELMTRKDKGCEERLAAALRENLRRRKAQSREIGTLETDDRREIPRS